MSRDMICVYRAADLGEADVVAAWLRERGFEALVKDSFAAATMQTSLIVAPRGVEVCVMDSDQAERAVALLTEHFHTLRRRSPDGAEGTVNAACEECGRTAEFPAAQRGSVQDCPHCGAYLDVPDA